MRPPAARKEQQTFALSVLLVCAAVAAHQWRHGSARMAAAAALLGALVFAVGRVAPGCLRVPSAGWWRALRGLGWVNTRVILGAVFFVMLTPAGIIRRLAHRMRTSAAPESGWQPAPADRRGPHHYERMY